MKSLLFIGGTGFLGQSFFDYLNKDKLNNFKLSNIIIVSRKKKKIKSKIKINYITKSISNIKSIPITDYVIYAANSTNNLENLKGIYNFINLLNSDHKKTKILFTSSGAVYGPRKIKKKMNERDKVDFYKINKFSNYKKEYAKSKIIMEKELFKLSKKGFKISIARLFTFIGKKILINKNFGITNLIHQAKNNNSKFISLKDDREVYRGYMNADDLTRWLLAILIKTNKKFNIYNVGSDEVISIEKLAELISKIYNKKIFKKTKNYRKKNKDIDYYVPSIAKARHKLNLNLNYKIKKSLSELLNNNIDC